jgi:hypothetical protein
MTTTQKLILAQRELIKKLTPYSHSCCPDKAISKLKKEITKLEQKIIKEENDGQL